MVCKLAATLIALGLLTTSSPSFAVDHRVVPILHIEWSDTRYEDLVGYVDGEEIAIMPRSMCEEVVYWDVVRMMQNLQINNVPFTSVDGFCFNKEEFKKHLSTHDDSVKSIPGHPDIPLGKRIES